MAFNVVTLWLFLLYKNKIWIQASDFTAVQPFYVSNLCFLFVEALKTEAGASR